MIRAIIGIIKRVNFIELWFDDEWAAHFVWSHHGWEWDSQESRIKNKIKK